MKEKVFTMSSDAALEVMETVINTSVFVLFTVIQLHNYWQKGPQPTIPKTHRNKNVADGLRALCNINTSMHKISYQPILIRNIFF